MSSKSLLIGMVSIQFNKVTSGTRHALARFARDSERESRLQIDAAIQAALREGAEAARQIIRFAKQRRGDDAVDGSGIDVIEQVARLDG